MMRPWAADALVRICVRLSMPTRAGACFAKRGVPRRDLAELPVQGNVHVHAYKVRHTGASARHTRVRGRTYGTAPPSHHAWRCYRRPR